MLPDHETPPYPVDEAAMHHVFDGGWIWVLRFNNGITSAGVAATEGLSNQLRLSDGSSAWNRLLQRLPTVREQFQESAACFPFIYVPRLSFRSQALAGSRWALLPSAAGFVDPLLSTGFPLTLLGIVRLARALEEDFNSPRLEGALMNYARRTREELELTADLVGALYATMKDFELFGALSLLYFTAASFSEAARRLDRPGLAPGFLLLDHPDFGPRVRDCCRRVREAAVDGGLAPGAKIRLMAEIRQLIEPFDVAGLNDRGRRNWFPVDPRDLLNAAGKLEATESEVRTMLLRCGVSLD
jgi:FADH2 O2-dependent halogenase